MSCAFYKVNSGGCPVIHTTYPNLHLAFLTSRSDEIMSQVFRYIAKHIYSYRRFGGKIWSHRWLRKDTVDISCTIGFTEQQIYLEKTHLYTQTCSRSYLVSIHLVYTNLISMFCKFHRLTSLWRKEITFSELRIWCHVKLAYVK